MNDKNVYICNKNELKDVFSDWWKYETLSIYDRIDDCINEQT